MGYMHKNAEDPIKTPVYSRDAWTQVFPAYVEDTIMPAEKEISREIIDYGNLYTPSTPAKYGERNGEFEDDVESFLRSEGAKYLFLKSTGLYLEAKNEKEWNSERICQASKDSKNIGEPEKIRIPG